jgi:hypothetical protein
MPPLVGSVVVLDKEVAATVTLLEGASSNLPTSTFSVLPFTPFSSSDSFIGMNQPSGSDSPPSAVDSIPEIPITPESVPIDAPVEETKAVPSSQKHHNLKFSPLSSVAPSVLKDSTNGGGVVRRRSWEGRREPLVRDVKNDE